MELWFMAAVMGAVLSGLANFVFKIAAKRDFHPSQFSFYGGVASVVMLLPLIFIFSDVSNIVWLGCLLAFVSGCLGGFNNIGKVKALQFIDTTIYFPLFKLVSPIITIVLGILFFGELFSHAEWLGLLLGIFVPLLLISPSENGRQNNLKIGLLLVLVTGLLAAIGSAITKSAILIAGDIILVLVFMSLGIAVGSILADGYKGGAAAIKKLFTWESDRMFLGMSILRSVIISAAVGFLLYAYGNGGPLAIVHTINSMYILIPVVLSIVFYDEHWNLQKVAAIILSVAALALLG